MDAFRPASAPAALRHVFLRDMTLLASVGIHAFEHEARQRIRLNIDLAVLDEGVGPLNRPLSLPGAAKDELRRVVDYERVADRVREIVASGHVRLVETLAERIAEACLEGRPACEGFGYVLKNLISSRIWSPSASKSNAARPDSPSHRRFNPPAVLTPNVSSRIRFYVRLMTAKLPRTL